jgi:PfaD family protein
MRAKPLNNTPLFHWDPAADGRTAPWEPGLTEALYEINQPLTVVLADGRYHLAQGGVLYPSAGPGAPDGARPVVAQAWPVPLSGLGDPEFLSEYGLDFPYVAGSMANGISSVAMVTAMSRAGMLGFFGAGGLNLDVVETAIDRLQQELGDRPYGFNLIHSPNEPALEMATVDLYLRKGVRLVEASAYLDLTLPLVKYRVKGLYRDRDGQVIAPNRVMAKASRVEVAGRFFSPPPEKFLRELVALRHLTEDQARMAGEIPMAYDLTTEADSGGHTDNRPAVTLVPTMITLKDRLMDQHRYPRPLRVGAAGGVASPWSALAMFSMGAAYLLTGSVNQSAVESGTCDLVRDMLAKTGQADITMAPAADMFEMGVKVQVLKWGTMFAMRAAKLYDLYRNYDRLDRLPEYETANLEKNLFRAPLDQVWSETRAYFQQRDPDQVKKADHDPKHRMALVFRWYLGQASGWANRGDTTRQIDYQIFCGPAMGAFNEWVKGSFLEPAPNRDVVTLAMNFLFGAAVLSRINALRGQGLALPRESSGIRPLALDKIREYIK